MNKTLLELAIVAIITNIGFIFCNILELEPLHTIILMLPFTLIGLSYVIASYKYNS